MAGSDKNAARSVAGGNSTQPAQQVSKAQGSALDGEQLNSIRSSGTRPPASHEARLGIMVITILVFAFCFLVYHKMDVHQRNLTRAAIEPSIKVPPNVPPGGPVAEFLSQETQVAVTDPMVNIEDLSEGSPFGISDGPQTKSALENRSMTESFEMLEEPASAPSVESEPIRDSDSPQLALTEPSPLEPFEDATTGVADPPELQADFGFLDVPETQGAEPVEIPDTPVANDESSLVLESTPAFAIMEDAPVVATSEIPDAEQQSPDASLESAAEEQSFADPDAVEEPVLLAMTEPQQSNGFDKGLLLDESDPDAKAPLDDPAEFPSFDPASAEPTTAFSEPKSPSDSQGFNAVKNPGSRTKGHSIRTAGGSGSDGKFSLAAFNYQNGVSESAPDDGSMFDSVVVQNGDNYSKISKRVYGTMKYFSALAVFNQHRIPEPKNMRPGMVVLVPAKDVLEERYPELFVDSQSKIPETPGFLILDDGSPAYRVGERETISEISERFLGRSARWIEIYRLNQSVVKDPNKLKAGLILALPEDAAEVNLLP